MKRMVVLMCLAAVVAVAGFASAERGIKKKKPLPSEYGKVIINEFSAKAGMPPAVFDHWLHRKSYTCRLCHVDIGFAMTAGGTKIHAADNIKGYYCGACHNGIAASGRKKVFEACARSYSPEEYKRCTRCHAVDRDPAREDAFMRLAEKLPREPLGNGIDWEKAEAQGLIRLTDHLEGVSPKKASFSLKQDLSLKSKVEGMPDIVFSHTKHTVWNGCELCHPDIFMGIKKGATKYSMIELFDGKFCGVCHGTVAFPQYDCQRCHSKPVQG